MRVMSPEEQRKIEISDTDQVMSTETGRRFVHRLLTECRVDEDIWHEDIRTHDRASGKRAIGLFLRGELKHACPEKYNLMMKEGENDV